MTGAQTKIAIVWRGDREARETATPQINRCRRAFEELARLGIAAEPAVYDEALTDELSGQLLAAAGGLALINPIQDGRSREAPVLRLRDS
jgi:hypothetical protein